MHENYPRTNTETFSSMISTIVCDTTATNTVEFNFSAAKTVTSGMYLNNNVTYRQCLYSGGFSTSQSVVHYQCQKAGFCDSCYHHTALVTEPLLIAVVSNTYTADYQRHCHNSESRYSLCASLYVIVLPRHRFTQAWSKFHFMREII